MWLVPGGADSEGQWPHLPEPTRKLRAAWACDLQLGSKEPSQNRHLLLERRGVPGKGPPLSLARARRPTSRVRAGLWGRTWYRLAQVDRGLHRAPGGRDLGHHASTVKWRQYGLITRGRAGCRGVTC